MKAYYLDDEVEILGFDTITGVYGVPYQTAKIKRLGYYERFEGEWTQTVLLADIVIR